jgi:hypothetical protein
VKTGSASRSRQVTRLAARSVRIKVDGLRSTTIASAALSATIGPITEAAAGRVVVAASVTATLDDLTLSAAAADIASASLAAALDLAQPTLSIGMGGN